MKVTESFMGLSLGLKQCQNKVAYLDCKTEAYLNALMDNCKCLPFDLKYYNDTNMPLCNSSQLTCAKQAQNLENECKMKCEGLVVTSYSHQNKSNALDTFSDLIESYKKYKGIIDLPGKISKLQILFISSKFSDIAWNNNQLRYVRIFFDSPTFDRITKDRAAKFVDMLSAIGGTMGLLTGFSIISGVEILYYFAQFIFDLIFANKVY